MAYTSQLEQIAGIRSIARSLTGGDAELSIASATTTDIGSLLSNRVLITGTTTITSFGTVANLIRFVRFNGALTLTYNATSLILPSAANITTAANDLGIFTSDGSGNWRCISYTKANGQAVVGSAGGSVVRQSYTATAGQTTQTVSGGYTAGQIDVYVNGSKLVNGDDVIVTSGTSVTFTVPLIVGDAIDIIGSLGATGSALLSSAIRQSLTPSTEGQTVFTVAGGYAPNALDVYYNGSKLQPVTDVTTSSGSTITLQFPTTLTDVIDVVGVNVLSAIGSVSRQSFTATAGQTTFTVSGGYQPNAIDVYQNGVKLQNGVDVTVTSGTSVVLAVAASLSDIIDVCASQQAAANGVTNLGTTQSSTTVTVTSDTGGSAVLPAATTSNAGVMSAADKFSLRNYGMKNRIINGDMSVWQRGTSISSGLSTLTYIADRWTAYATGAAVTMVRSAGDGEFQYCLANTGAAGNTAVNIAQKIESVNAYCAIGTVMTVRCRVYSSTTFTPTYSIDTANSVDNFSSTTNLVISAFSAVPAATWTTVSFTFTTNAACQNGFQVTIGLGACSSGVIRQITGVQLELGSQATEFEHRPYGTELALCQRYYQTGNSVWRGYATSGIAYGVYTRFGINMRTSPTVTVSNNTATSFPSTASSSSANASGIELNRTANTTAGGIFGDDWTVSAEL